ncbi:TetR/AcrR family transcriptional regulator [Halomonas nitroreducens]|uniref:TetR family transcriptional regulator n=1 Tax=Halomonas nitroreducens TaxID=447425 RepID=A0A431V8R8_9GAMM|nr:TetR/AcrR family transcriptional regulator [Halomonas nitroreducens]RTR07076.1 TetR family transcriptional regulator [Halomonas nitroreducens]
MKQSATRDRLIQAGMALIAEHGYNATGINTVLKAAAVPKGSFYHYFSSKEDFGLAVIDATAEGYTARLEAMLADSDVPALQRLQHYFAAGRADMVDCDHARGCLIGNLGQELSGHSARFRDRLDQVLSGWERLLADCLRDGQTRSEIRTDLDPDALASFILSGWEGALIRAKTVKSVAPLERFETVLLDCLRPS